MEPVTFVIVTTISTLTPPETVMPTPENVYAVFITLKVSTVRNVKQDIMEMLWLRTASVRFFEYQTMSGGYIYVAEDLLRKSIWW